MGSYSVCLEIAGPTAMWTRPDSGDAPTSYPVPTRCAVKGIFESVLWLQTAVVIPTKTEICAPIAYHTYTTNYGGPLRKSGTTNYQLMATVLINVCYRIFADVIPYKGPQEKMNERGRSWARVNGAHAYQAMLDKRLRRGQFYRTPCLGWQEFVPDYVGLFRPCTNVQKDLNFVLPSMLETVFPDQHVPVRNPRYRQNVKIEKGTLVYAS
jgi:CRISPR-associated protein Cas5d